MIDNFEKATGKKPSLVACRSWHGEENLELIIKNEEVVKKGVWVPAIEMIKDY